MDDAGRTDLDWRQLAGSLLADNHFYVSCQVDDDLPYLIGHFGANNLVHGTDYSHMDKGSDPYGLHIIASRGDISNADTTKIVDTNARTLWGIAPDYRPAPSVELHPEVVQAPKGWTWARK